MKRMKVVLLGLFLISLLYQGEGVAANVQFEIVSVNRVNTINSNAAGNRYINWAENQNENGVLIILKSKKPMFREVYSVDFSLGYEDKSGIPRSPCIGISTGMKTHENPMTWTWWLGGSVSRSWITKEKRYIGLIFSVPKRVNKFVLYDSLAIFKDIEIKGQ